MLKPLLVALAATTPAHGAVIEFATRAAFDAAAGPLQTQTFARCVARTLAFAGPLDAMHPDAACPAGAVRPGLSLADAGPGGGGLYIAAPGYAGNRERAVGQNNRAADALVLDFGAGTHAAGFDIFQNFGGGAQLGRAAPFGVRLWSGATIIADVSVLVPSGRGAFFGALSPDAAITRIAVSHPLAYDLVGDIAFSRAVAAPAAGASTAEPASLALLCLATATLVLRRR